MKVKREFNFEIDSKDVDGYVKEYKKQYPKMDKTLLRYIGNLSVERDHLQNRCYDVSNDIVKICEKK